MKLRGLTWLVRGRFAAAELRVVRGRRPGWVEDKWDALVGDQLDPVGGHSYDELREGAQEAVLDPYAEVVCGSSGCWIERIEGVFFRRQGQTGVPDVIEPGLKVGRQGQGRRESGRPSGSRRRDVRRTCRPSGRHRQRKRTR